MVAAPEYLITAAISAPGDPTFKSAQDDATPVSKSAHFTSPPIGPRNHVINRDAPRLSGSPRTTQIPMSPENPTWLSIGPANSIQISARTHGQAREASAQFS